MNKKILSLAMAIMICIATSIPAFAANSDMTNKIVGGITFVGRINGTRNSLTGKTTTGNNFVNGTFVEIWFDYVSGSDIRQENGQNSQETDEVTVTVTGSYVDYPVSGRGEHYGAGNGKPWTGFTFFEYAN